MSQHDMDLANAAGASFRSDANQALVALVSNSSGATAPATTFAYQFWADTTSGWLKQRDAANAAWILRAPLGTGAAVDVASAATLDLTANAANSATLRITGTTTTTAITLADGQQRLLRAAAAWPITNGANLIVQGNADYTCNAGDIVHAFGEPAGVVRLVIWKADGSPVLGAISPAQITADQNDYNPAGLATASVLRINSDAARNVTGLQGGSRNRVVTVHNVGAFAITLKDEAAGSTAANRFALTADLALAADAVALLQYDATSSRWRAIGGGGGSGSGVLNKQVFTAGGTFTIPAGVTASTVFKVTVVGGGGGGGSNSGGAVSGGTGGGAGGMAVKWFSGWTAGNTIAVTVGSGGGSGAAGGNSSVASGTQTITTVTGNGGSAGSASGTYPGVSGGSATNGDLNVSGNSSSGVVSNTGGWGGNGFFGGGASGQSATGSAAAANTGGGGGGAGFNGGTSAAGGAGGSGLVIFEWVL